jgi:putative transposase
MSLINEACIAGARHEASCNLLGISCKTIQRWKSLGLSEDKRRDRTVPPHNKLSTQEQQKILHTVNNPRYAEMSPAKIVPKLADQGEYIASESTIYRLLRAKGQVKHRQASKPTNKYKPKAIRAIKPNQVYSWDITYLSSSVKGVFFYLYLILDIYSRKIVGWQVYDKESSCYASDVLEAACLDEGIQREELTLHSDNGSPMKGATMLVTLQRLGVIPSFSRPGVSNDNPYSESLFRTLKYGPKYPEQPFKSMAEARIWVGSFVKWYNEEHFHSGIKFVTPAQRHRGLDREMLEARHLVYQEAKRRNPHRWSGKTRNWEAINEVQLNPEKGKSIHKLNVAV